MYDWKGESLISFPEDFTVIDIETTGLDFEYCEIIEVAAIKVRNNKVVDKISTCAHPLWADEKFSLPQYISDLTGITTEMVMNAPAIDVVLNKFSDFVGDDILIGHNIVSFDGNFLCAQFSNVLNRQFKNSYVDTLRLSRWLLKNLQHHRLMDVAEYYNINNVSAHRALSDCCVALECFFKLKNTAISEYGSVNGFYDYVKQKKKDKYNGHTKQLAKFIEQTVNSSDINPENFLYGKTCAFTGKLNTMTRKEAMQIVKNLGGKNSDNVTMFTNLLIIGDLDYITSVKEGKSNKIKKVEKYKAMGIDIDVVSESTFIALISE